MITAMSSTLEPGSVTTPRPRGRPRGSKDTHPRRRRGEGAKNPHHKEKINYVYQPLLEPENTPKPRAIRGAWRVADMRMAEARRVLAAHPRMPAGWKRNIRAYLERLMARCPYQANWVWATGRTKRDMRKAIPKIMAPFAYFRECLLHPEKFKMQTAEQTKWRIAGWLQSKAATEQQEKRRSGDTSDKTKWGGAAWAYRYRHGLVTKKQAERREARRWERTLSREIADDLRLSMDAAAQRRKAAAEEFQRTWEAEKQARRLMKAQLATALEAKPSGQGDGAAQFEEQVRRSLGLSLKAPVSRTPEQEKDLRDYLARRAVAQTMP